MLSESMRLIPLHEANTKQLISFMNSQCDIGESVETFSDARIFWNIDPSMPDSEVGTYLHEWSERNKLNPTYFILDTYVEDYRPHERKVEEQVKEYQTVTLPGLGTCEIYPLLDRIVYLEYQYEYYFGSTVPLLNDEESIASLLREDEVLEGIEVPSSLRKPITSLGDSNSCTLYFQRIKVRDTSLSEYKALISSIG